MRKIQLKGVQNPDVSILIRFIFDTTQLFDVTFLLRNIIVTLEAKQKPPRKIFQGGFTFKFD